MTDYNEKISALYDGELSSTETDELLARIEDEGMQDQLKKYAQLSALIASGEQESKPSNLSLIHI